MVFPAHQDIETEGTATIRGCCFRLECRLRRLHCPNRGECDSRVLGLARKHRVLCTSTAKYLHHKRRTPIQIPWADLLRFIQDQGDIPGVQV